MTPRVSTSNEVPAILPVKSGWAAIGNGWAVHGTTKEEALYKFQEALALHKKIDMRAALHDSAAEGRTV